MRRLLLSAAAVASIVVGGCGGRSGDAAPTMAAFVAQAEERCAGAAAVMREHGLTGVDQRHAADDMGEYRVALRARRLGYLEVRDLETPEGQGQRVRAFVDAAVEGIDQLVEQNRAKERGDVVADGTARDRAAAALGRARDLGRALGFTECLP